MSHTTTFSETLSPVDKPYVPCTINNANFGVFFGLREQDTADISPIAASAAVREFCPKDISSRFGNVEMAERWVAKGRTMFQLRELGRGGLAGYGWTGLETSPEIPGGDTTFAVRLAPEFAGRGLATPFTRAIVAGSSALHGGNIWLETWGSNTAAVRTYVHAGAQLVTTRDATRPTLNPGDREIDDTRRDVRLFMCFSD